MIIIKIVLNIRVKIAKLQKLFISNQDFYYNIFNFY